MFNIKTTQRKTQLSVKIEGALTIYTVEDAANQLRELDKLDQKVVCDLSAVNELDTTGIQLLLSLVKSTNAKGGELIISKVNQLVNEVIDLFALSAVLGVRE